MTRKTTTIERVSVLESKVDDLRTDIVEMRQENRADHNRVIERLEKLQDLKNYVLGIVATASVILTYIATLIDWRILFQNAFN